MSRRRKQKGGSETRPSDVENYWPSPASPVRPPRVNFYFTRKFADGTYDTPGQCAIFLHPWQAGVFLREILESGVEEVEVGPLRSIFPGIADGRVGSAVDYLVPTERDEDGRVVKGRRFECSLLGVTYEEALELAEDHQDIRVPYVEDAQRRAAIGMKPRSLAAWERRDDSSSIQYAAPKEKQKREKRERVERAPRESRDGLTSLTQICAKEKVEASDVRAVLRSMKIEKPAVGWAWKEPPDYVAKAIKKAKEKA